MSITVIDPATSFDELQHQALDVHAARMLPHIPKFGGSGCLSTDLFAGDNLSHPRTSVRSEGR
jgi:hypothetical protein